MFSEYQDDLKAHKRLNINFGMVYGSLGLGTVTWERRRCNEDWAVVAVYGNRGASDYMQTDFMKGTEKDWRPHNRFGQYLVGVGTIETDDEKLVRKWSLKTGVTTGPLQ